MTVQQTEPDTAPLDRRFAVEWYEGWLDAWNNNRPERVSALLTEDFVLDSPTTRHTGMLVRGHRAAHDYITYVLGAYPDLEWQVTAPPLFSDDIARAAFSWTGTGHFSGRMDPPGIEGTGRAFEFSGLEVFDFRGERACRLYATYDLLGLMKQIGLHRGSSKGR
ncbi:ester cyclase [Pseudonocardia spinosispora]|uniref:ester cyclase n=1 Tax=Pseudonocardia spinosispora TaxID=103441 RepID=UPI00042634E9|nr:nuclear transport factor 2 family protein [Pseudonocardia spinosispora]